MKRADTSRLRKKARRPTPILSRGALEHHLQNGGRVCKSLPRIESEPVSWFCPVTNRTIGSRPVAWAFEKGMLRGCEDGLFGEHQTYERAA
jgi:hypothetical protein